MTTIKDRVNTSQFTTICLLVSNMEMSVDKAMDLLLIVAEEGGDPRVIAKQRGMLYAKD